MSDGQYRSPSDQPPFLSDPFDLRNLSKTGDIYDYDEVDIPEGESNALGFGLSPDAAAALLGKLRSLLGGEQLPESLQCFEPSNADMFTLLSMILVGDKQPLRDIYSFKRNYDFNNIRFICVTFRRLIELGYITLDSERRHITIKGESTGMSDVEKAQNLNSIMDELLAL